MARLTTHERRFVLRSGLEMAARIHHPGAATRVLAVHGWLDNAASFDALAGCLPDCEIVAVDLVGHGRSDHRAAGGWYAFADYLDELVQVLDQLDWQRSLWLGHSMGGALLSLLAAALPDRVDRLVLVESGGPLSGAPDDAVAQLRRGLADRLRFRADRSLRVFASVEQAVDARRKANGLSDHAARALVERGVRAVDGGVCWSTDPRLMLASPFRIDESHVRELLAGITCPVLLLLADPPLPFMTEAGRETRLALPSMVQRHDFAGNHHLHMESSEPLARCIGSFLADPVRH